ncbi:GyrI-like domain-containing protein [Conexibacter arvalis]|uniref:DNA gyrase inhibitor GyrI n=1 Tax=Conexibacter arvalis TaxID=912552 RepID=A0A840IDQ3_9ACTN|nr:GyrI-like domain-containing protein [Conexibacter arvalis]MBB4662363.1 DNA gyrase inhibitor GyrI [Conexibacter arvalis]
MTTQQPDLLAASTPPRIEERPAQPYVALHAEGDVDDFRATVDEIFPALFAWLGEHGVEPAGPPFMSYPLYEEGGRFVVDVAAPLATGAQVAGDGRARVDFLPAGRWLVYDHRGAYRATTARWEGRDLAAAHELVIAHALDNRLRFAGEQSDDGFRFEARVERYLAGPPQIDDPADWRTELAFLLAD